MNTIYLVRTKISPEDSPHTFFEQEYVVESYGHASTICAEAQRLGGRASCVSYTVVRPEVAIYDLRRVRDSL